MTIDVQYMVAGVIHIIFVGKLSILLLPVLLLPSHLKFISVWDSKGNGSRGLTAVNHVTEG